MYIYKITNKINGKVYIGQTTQNPKTRWGIHKTDARGKDFSKHHYLHNAMNKHGIENFTFEVLEETDSLDKLNEREVHWIAFYEATKEEFGYNLREGGCKNSKHSEKTKKRIAEKLKGNKNGLGKILPVEEFEKRLKDKHGNTIKIDRESYEGFNRPCFFIDRDYGRFKAYPSNVLVGWGNSFRANKAKKEKRLTKSIETVKLRLEELFGNEIRLVEESFRGMLVRCQFKFGEEEFTSTPVNINRGYLPKEIRKKLDGYGNH